MAKSQPAGAARQFLKETRQETRWFSLASLLDSAISDPRRFGFSSADEMLARVAEARSQHPGALRGPIAAHRFLKENFEAFASQEHIACGFSSVQVLAAIHQSNAEKARDLLEGVLGGRLSTRSLRQIYREMTEQKSSTADTRLGPAATAKRRSVAFARAVEGYIQENIHLLCEHPNAHLSDRREIGPLAPDLLIVAGKKPLAAVEIRTPGSSVYRRQINEMVGLCALTLRRVPEIWVIGPRSAQEHLQRMASVAAAFGLDGAHFACLDEAKIEKKPTEALTVLGAGTTKNAWERLGRNLLPTGSRS